MREESSVIAGSGERNRVERGRRGEGPGAVFSVLSHVEPPPRAVGALSCITTSSLISCFHALCSPRCKRSQRRPKHPSCFIHNDDTIIQLCTWCALHQPCGSSLKMLLSPLSLSLSVSVSLYLFYLHLPLTSPQLFVASLYLPSSLSLSQRVPSPIVFPISWLTSHFPFLHCASLSFIFALVSSVLHWHQLLYTEQRVITFVLHGVSLIGFMPLSSATSAEKQIEAFCHI